jgi:arylsulfatase A-like enzyme
MPRDLARYHDSVARMDSVCGQVLDLLRRRGDIDNTVVYFALTHHNVPLNR